MKAAYLIVFLLVCAGLAPAREPVVNKDAILPFPIYTAMLPNGLNVVTVPFESPGIAAFYIVMRVGSREETEEGKTGFAHFVEHMMFRGTEKYPKEKYSETLKSIGASANANTSLDRTVYHMTGDATKLDKMFELEADRFMNLGYSMQDFRTEAGAVKGEYTKNYSDPKLKLYETYLDTAFSRHTYSHTTMGTFADIVDMPNQYEYSKQFFDRFYRPEYATIIVVGDVRHPEVKQLAEKHFGAWSKGNYRATIPAEPPQKSKRTAHMQVAQYPPQLTMAYKAPAFSDSSREAAALSLLTSVISSEKSKLHKKLVIEERKARSFNASYYFTRDPYLFSISATVVNEADLQYVYDQVKAFVAAIKQTPVDTAFLREIKSRARYGFAMGMDSPDDIAGALSYFTWLTGDPQSINRYYAMLNTITAKEISDAAARILIDTRLTIATISSDKVQQLKY